MAKCSPNTVIALAKSQVGYLEKKSNSNLDDFTKNAGSKNYTKYNREYLKWGPGGAQPMEWCGAFVSWCFVTAYGIAAAKALLCGNMHCYTPNGAKFFKNKKRYIKRGSGKPQAGDVVFFFSSSKGRIGHVGIVEKVTSSRVYTIEGNTSGASTLVTNGGGVKRKNYSLSSSYIDGYGRPDYANVESVSGEVYEPDLGDRLLENGMEGEDVKELQSNLIALGYDCGKWGADGDFGDATEIALMRFQRDHGCDDDGEYGPITHKAMTAAIAAQKPVEAPRTVRIVGGNCWARMSPSTAGDRLGVAVEGSVLTYGGQTAENGWHLVEFENQNAWVSGKYSKLEG